jgi:hypothetical protein
MSQCMVELTKRALGNVVAFSLVVRISRTASEYACGKNRENGDMGVPHQGFCTLLHSPVMFRKAVSSHGPGWLYGHLRVIVGWATESLGNPKIICSCVSSDLKIT